jgi:putative phage-type endonuclease
MIAPPLHGFGAAVMVLSAGDYRKDRARWLAARRSGLGASDTAAILGLNNYRTALDVWLDKTSPAAPVDDELSEAAAWGHILETPVARRTVKKHPHLGKLVPTPGLLAHPDHPWMLATVDFGLAARGSRDAPVRSLLEVKTTSVHNYRANWIDGVPPAGIQVQAQQQMAVTGLDECWVTCFVGGDSGPGKLAEPYRVARSETVIEQLIHYAGTWWADHVAAHVRPEPTFADADKLAMLYPADDAADAVVMDAGLEDVLADYLDHRRRADALALRADELRFRLQKAMAERTALAWPDGRVAVTNKEQVRKSLDKKALAAERPDVADVVRQYTRPGKPFRVFLVKGETE